MCYCGTVEKDGFYQCCQDQITMNQESRYFGGQMSKAEMVRWDMERDVKAREQQAIERAKFKEACSQETTIDGETQKIKVAAAYRPRVEILSKCSFDSEEFKEEWGKLGGDIKKLEVPANETPREALLQRDVGILFNENRALKAENERLIKSNSIIMEQNVALFRANQKLFLYNQKLIEKRKNHADM